MNFYKHHIGDFDQATRHLSFVEDAAYCRMIRKYYAEECPLPKDLKKIQRLIGARTKEERAAVEMVLEEFFVLEDDGYHQVRCDEELEAAWAKADVNRRVGKLGGRPRKTETQTEPTNNPDGLLLETQTVSENNPSQTPDSRLQTPDLKAAQWELDTPPAEEPPDALPEIQSTLTPEQKAAIPVVTKLRTLGVTITSANPLAAEWIAKGLTLDRVAEVVEFARLKGKPTGPIHPNFIHALLDDALNPPKPKPKQDDWHRTDEGIKRKAKELGVSARGGWSFAQLKDSVWDEIRRRERQGEAA